jgi:hypothetical protein
MNTTEQASRKNRLSSEARRVTAEIVRDAVQGMTVIVSFRIFRISSIAGVMGLATGHDKRSDNRDEQVFHNLFRFTGLVRRTVAAG